MQDIIKLYRNFKKYDQYSDIEIRLDLFPSMNLSQFKKHYENDTLIGFTNWAYVSDSVLNNFKKTGILRKEDWKSGINLLFVDFVAIKNVRKIFKWCINEAKQFKGLKEYFLWARIKDNKIHKFIKRKR